MKILLLGGLPKGGRTQEPWFEPQTRVTCGYTRLSGVRVAAVEGIAACRVLDA